MFLSINDPECINLAKKHLAQNGIVAFPTDTIYGLAANIHSKAGLRKIYEIKKRPEEKALPVLIGDLAQLQDLVAEISDHVWQIANAFWPGPLTLVLPKKTSLPKDLSPYPTIGIRMPNLPFTLALLRETGPLATTSANISNGPNPTTAQEVLCQLGNQVDLILDGGPTPGPMASTVIDAVTEEIKILREGPISLEALRNALEERS